MKGQRTGNGQGRGQGQGAGAGSGGGRGAGYGKGGGGMGAGGSCLCPKCGRRSLHRQGVPCLQERCPDCGVAMVREGSAHHQEIVSRRGNADGVKKEG
jgi:hypothetical protein